jgi:hypothetical protein
MGGNRVFYFRNKQTSTINRKKRLGKDEGQQVDLTVEIHELNEPLDWPVCTKLGFSIFALFALVLHPPFLLGRTSKISLSLNSLIYNKKIDIIII